MKLNSIINKDTTQYKKKSMVLLFPSCSMKCGKKRCNNAKILLEEPKEYNIEEIIDEYLKDNSVSALVCSGLEPFDSWKDLKDLIMNFRFYTKDDVVIYTGYTEEELRDKLPWLEVYENIIVKFGKYLHKNKPIFDELLGITLPSENQYAKQIGSSLS